MIICFRLHYNVLIRTRIAGSVQLYAYKIICFRLHYDVLIRTRMAGSAGTSQHPSFIPTRQTVLNHPGKHEILLQKSQKPLLMVLTNFAIWLRGTKPSRVEKNELMRLMLTYPLQFYRLCILDTREEVISLWY